MATHVDGDGTFTHSAVKIQRAKKHVSDIEAEVIAFLATNPVKWQRLPGSTPDEVFFHYTFNAPPLELAAMLGDAIHNLRSALDLMACELVRLNGHDDNGVYFPFSGTESDLDTLIKRRNFDLAGAFAVALLKTFAPFKGGNVPLRAIHDLDIHDKHQAIIPRGIISRSPGIRQVEGPDGPTLDFIDGDEPLVALSFPEGPLSGQPLIPTLNDLVQVTERVVEAFAAEAKASGKAK